MLKGLFNPSSIAVIGASNHHEKIGFSVLKNIVDGGFAGRIYPINPDTDSIIGLKCYPSVLAVKRDIDLAVIVVPAKIVPQVLIECGKKKVSTAIIITAGFAEMGREGLELQEAIAQIASLYHISILGPNCLGLIDPVNKLNISFGGAMPKRKDVAFISQSGATGTAILDWAKEKGIGFSHFISLGNKLDLNENDFLRYLSEDKNTRVILCYLESISNGEEFFELAKEIATIKPIIILKAGKTPEGQKAASSHTAAMASDELVVETALTQAGIIQAETLEDFFELALAFSQLEKVKNEVLVITNAGGPAVMTADSLALSKNLKLYDLMANEKSQIKKALPEVNPSNPLDLVGDATSERFEMVLKQFKDKEFYKIVMITPQVATDVDKIAKTIVKYKDKKAIVVLIGGQRFVEARKTLAEAEIPVFSYPERAVHTLSLFLSQRDPEKKPVYINGFKKIPSKIFEKGTELSDAEIAKILAAYHIPMEDSFLTTNANEAIDVAKRIGFPIVLKVTSPDILHKTEVGAVKLNISNEEELRTSYQEVLKNAKKKFPNAKILGVTVYKMHLTRVEIALGAKRDPVFGPVIMFGVGGIYIEIIKDFKLAIAPISVAAAREMIQSIKLYPLLNGYRGGVVCDIEAIAKAISGLSMLMEDFEEIKEIDINPLAVGTKDEGILALDAKIIFEKAKVLVS